jgi:hypothetical protein
MVAPETQAQQKGSKYFIGNALSRLYNQVPEFHTFIQAVVFVQISIQKGFCIGI